MNNLNFWSLLNEYCFSNNHTTLQKVKLRTQRRCLTPQSVTYEGRLEHRADRAKSMRPGELSPF